LGNHANANANAIDDENDDANDDATDEANDNADANVNGVACPAFSASRQWSRCRGRARRLSRLCSKTLWTPDPGTDARF
jgi:hypothetical protein